MLIAIGSVLLFVPHARFPDFYHPVYMGIASLFSVFLIHLPLSRLMRRAARKPRLILEARSAVAFSVSLNMAGELGLFQLYRFGFEYDKFAHFSVCLLFTWILCKVFVEGEYLTLRKALVFAALIVFASGILWEAIEFSSDILFGTQEWGVYGQDTLSDTVKDMLFNVLGILFGATIFTVREKQNALFPKGMRIS